MDTGACQQDVKCQFCGKENEVMKRCTRCYAAYYCSRECQVKSWSKHKRDCYKDGKDGQPNRCTKHEKQTSVLAGVGHHKTSPRQTEQEHVHVKDHSLTPNHQSDIKGIDSHDAFDCLKVSESTKTRKPTDSECREPKRSTEDVSRSYLYNNKVLFDLPDLDPEQPSFSITVKGNKRKLLVVLQANWGARDILKTLAHKMQIPLDAMKLIHKGKVITEELLLGVAKHRAVFQVIGREAESENGLESGDIDVLMKQLNVDRNDAVKALKAKGDLLDALLDLANK